MAAGVLIIALWWLVAHNAGSGWVQVLGDLVFGALLIGIVGPFVVVSRARVSVRSAPGDGSAGLPLEVQVRSRSRVRVRPVDPPGPEAFVGPAGRRGGADGVVTLLPVRRGVHDAVILDVASAAPFALQWWTKRVRLPLPGGAARGAPLRPGPARAPAPGRGDGRPPRSAPFRHGLPRGARPYVPGDPRRMVHWRATAHAGHMMVRELEQPAAEPVTITVELPADPEAAERVAEGALASVVGLLERGTPVLLGTREAAGPVVGAVADRRSAGRASPGPSPGREHRRGGPPGQPAGAARGLHPVAARLPGRRAGGDRRLRLSPGDRLDDGRGAMVLVAAGTVFSHATRARPPGWVKVMVAVGAIAACVWFFRSVSSPAGASRPWSTP